jgi:hypothetical protein
MENKPGKEQCQRELLTFIGEHALSPLRINVPFDNIELKTSISNLQLRYQNCNFDIEVVASISILMVRYRGKTFDMDLTKSISIEGSRSPLNRLLNRLLGM